MITGWHTWDGNKYYFREINESEHPDGSMVTGWANLKEDQDNNYWCFFNFDTGICEVEGQLSKGCEHGKTTYNDLILNTDVSSLHYMYTGTLYGDLLQPGADKWNDCNCGINITPDLAPHIAFVDSKLDTSYIATTHFIINGSVKNDPRSEGKNWEAAEIRLNSESNNVTTRTITHELGHALGLDHRDTDEESIMYRGISATDISEPSSIDVANIVHLYQW